MVKNKIKTQEKKSKEKPTKNNENLEKILKKMMKFFDAEASLQSEADGNLLINISSKNSSMLIGRFGQTLETLQYLTRLIANKVFDERVHLVLDVENYKANKNRELEELAMSCADNVQKSGYAQRLRPMNAYERRIIHTVLNDFSGVETVSIGEEPNRCIEIRPKAE